MFARRLTLTKLIGISNFIEIRYWDFLCQSRIQLKATWKSFPYLSVKKGLAPRGENQRPLYFQLSSCLP